MNLLSNSSLKKFIVIGACFSLLSSMRIPFLPEIQLFAFLLSLFSAKRNRIFSLVLLVCIMCTHHYVIPDVLFRHNSSEYPSIYTRSYYGVKLLDLLTMILFAISLRNIKLLKHIFLNRKIPIILLLLSLVGIASVPYYQQNFGNFLFILRSVILATAIYMLFGRLSAVDIQRLSFLAACCWITKMLFAILIPHENPMYRDVFGVQWNIHFAGDEYLTLGILFSTILFLTRATLGPNAPLPLDVVLSKIKILLFAALILALLAQRRGAIVYFLVIYLVIFIEDKYRFSRAHLKFNSLMLVSGWSIFLFISVLVPWLPDVYQFIFLENVNLLDSALSSLGYLAATDPAHFLLGLGPAGLYEIKDLLPISDHTTSFGLEVGSAFRYEIWSLPYGRLILNTGLVGFIIYMLYLIALLQVRASLYYLYSSIFPIFYFSNYAPPMAFACGMALSAIYGANMSNEKRSVLVGDVGEVEGYKATQSFHRLTF